MSAESALRTTMLTDAQSTRPSPDLAERIITAALEPATRTPTNSPGRDPHGWRNWVLPAVAALVAAILVGSVLLARDLFRSAEPASGPSTPTPAVSPGPTSPAPSGPSPSGTRIVPPIPSGPLTSAPVRTGPAGGPVPAGFRAIDLTWISTQDGWALGTAPCAKAPCTSMLRTNDGGHSWVGIPAPVAELSDSGNCQQACVSALRFANATVGYAFGANSLFMTTDGGATWDNEAGQADALEVANGTVLRVVSQGLGCGPGCRYELLRADVGSTSWTAVPLPTIGTSSGVGVTLVRTGRTAAIEVFGHPAGGASNATASLLTSSDDGATWVSRGEPCPQTGGGFAGNEVDSSALTSAPDGSLTVLCTPRGTPSGQFTVTSTDGGRTFRVAPRSLGDATGAVAAASASVLLAFSDAVYRSGDGGVHWQRVLVDPSLKQGASVGPRFIGFETTTTGRYVSADGKTVWTTTDAGAHWSRSLLG